jgi:hypothetical protein
MMVNKGKNRRHNCAHDPWTKSRTLNSHQEVVSNTARMSSNA